MKLTCIPHIYEILLDDSDEKCPQIEVALSFKMDKTMSGDDDYMVIRLPLEMVTSILAAGPNKKVLPDDIYTSNKYIDMRGAIVTVELPFLMDK